MIEPRSSFVDADTIRLHYLEWDPVYVHSTTDDIDDEETIHDDNDNVPVILLHGLGATANIWRPTARYLENHCVIAFDLRGHGLSDHPEHGYDPMTVAEDIIAGMAKLGLGQVAVVSHGWGGRIGLALAAHHPALVSHLVLVDSPLVEPRHWPGMSRERFIRDRQISPEIFASRTTYIKALRQEMEDFWSPEIEEILLAQVNELPDGRLEEYLRPEHEQLIREALWEDRALSYYSKISSPVLLIPAALEPQAGKELPESLESSVDFAAAKGHMAQQVTRVIARCSVLWMPDAIHNIHLERPAQLATSINRFLQDG